MNALHHPRALPEGIVLAFYGDDFTGSASTMEIMSFGGLPTVMFLDVPRPNQLARFSGYRCIGIAGVARSRPPQWMEIALPDYYRALADLGAPITHYKTCSTFDSAPHIGSIGRAIDLADKTFGDGWRPLLVAAPQIGRYQAFGNLYAAVSGVAYRLDRHPVMSRHPITPMDEADVRLHLAKQTNARIGLIDFVSIKQGRAHEKLAEELAKGAKIVALDVLDDETLIAAGRLLWESTGEGAFVAGSQGVEYALVAYWQSVGLLDAEPCVTPRVGAVDRIACVSGSCSAITARQIKHAIGSGFAAIRLDAACAVDERKWQGTIEAAMQRALDALGLGRDPLVFTALGPDDPAVGAVAAAVETSGAVPSIVNDRIGTGLGLILDKVMHRGRVSRGAIAGGDTSGYAVQATGAFALTAVASIAPGTPLCRAYADSPEHDGREIALKGGQLGGTNFFSAVRAGGPIA
jgi:uncharacterized protein YgbK (DUF1537 family)